MGGKSGGSAPSPDPAIGQAALMQAKLGQQWMTFAKEQFAVANQRQAAQDIIANQVTQQQLDASKQSMNWAKEDRKRYLDVFRPLEDQFIETANNWDSKERQESVAAEAKADVINSATQQRQATQRNMASMGVDPTSGRFAGVDRTAEVDTALAAAGAQNTARNTVRNQAVAMKGEAVNMGKGLAVNPATSLGLSTGAGSAAMQTTAGNNAQAAGNSAIMGQGFSGAMSGFGNQANILNAQYGNQLNAWSANQQSNNSMWGGIGSLAGMGLMAFSSKEYKEDKKPAKGSLDAVRRMPVGDWKYKDGISDGGHHVGPYAEDFKEATGKGDGKTINLMDAVGVTMGAVQELAKKVDKISGGKGLPQRRAA